MNLIPVDLKQVPNFDQQSCFGCGAANPHGLQMRFYTDEQKLYTPLTIPERMTGWEGTVHGGIVSTVLDEIMGWTAIYLLKKIVVTRSMTIDFIKPVRACQPLQVIGRVKEVLSERSALVVGEIYDGEGVLLARGTGDFSTMNGKTAVRLGVMSEDYLMKFSQLLGPDFIGK